MKYKKASAEVGIGIIGLAILLLLGGIITDEDNSDNINVFKNNKPSSSQNNFNINNNLNTEGFYDENGNYVYPGSGHYDENGNFVFSAGYYDEDGNFVYYNGYYDEYGNFIYYDYGYYDENGNFVYYNGILSQNVIFSLNETNIGKQKKVTENYPNVELGSKIEYNTIYLGNTFSVISNPFAKSSYSFDVNFKETENINNYLVYFKPTRINGKQDLIMFVDGKRISKNNAKKTDIPYFVNEPIINETATITFQMEKPSIVDLGNWNKMLIEDLRIIEERQNKENNIKEFNFDANKENLERVFIDMVISCEKNTQINPAIVVKVNDYIVQNSNPDCTSNYNRITANVPLTALNNSKNTLIFETNGYYKIAYNLNKIYYNDQDRYRFNVNNFNDIYDIILYGDFDKEIIDLKINQYTISLQRDKVKSILHYLRYGTNEIEILTKPVEIKELVIEVNEYIDFTLSL
jgi:hypothetical protein